VVRIFLIGCAFLLIVGCAGTSSETSKKEQGSSPQATASEEEARCEGTRTYHLYVVVSNGRAGPLRSGSEEDMKKAGKTEDLGVYTTNDIPGCPKGGLLLGTDKPNLLGAKHGDDEVRGLGGRDGLDAGPGNAILYGGDGEDGLFAGKGEDVMYGGDGNDLLVAAGDGRDKLYCGKGQDEYDPVENTYVDSSCEHQITMFSAG